MITRRQQDGHMNKGQAKLFVNLTRLQQHVSLAKLNNESTRKAYVEGGGKSKTDNSTDVAISVMLKSDKVMAFMEAMVEEAVERALCTTEDIVKGLLRESCIGEDKEGDTTPASRVSAMKALTEYTGGFDKNEAKSKVIITDKSFNAFYDE